MPDTEPGPPYRILIIDDEPIIHFTCEQALQAGQPGCRPYEVDCVDNSAAALKAVDLACSAGTPFAVAFVDLQLGEDWNGLKTLEHLWAIDGDLQAVLCTANAHEARLGLERLASRHDQLLFLEKPFGRLEVAQFARALTRKWDLQRQMRAYASKLEIKVAERTAEIRQAHERLLETNAELVRARDRADAGSRAKSAFLANMSHEIRTPMTAILGFIDMLADPELPEGERGACVETVRRNARHLLELINDILDLSRVESGQVQIELREFQPRELLQEITTLLQPRASVRGIAFSTRVDAGVPASITSDAHRLRQILTNLIGNAVKFTDHGRIDILATLTVEEDREPLLKISVTDTGIGISAERLEEIFQPFAQADNSVTRRYGGTGLGLTISRQLARLLGGDVTAVSELGVGSTFEVAVPVRRPGERARASRDDETPRRSCAAAAPGGFRVLLAEDSPDLAGLYLHMLRRRGCQVQMAENGEQAVRMVVAAMQTEHPFDAVVMDMQMPVLDGYAATRQLRRAGYSGPVLAFTAHAMSGDRALCLQAGCDHYLTKPTDVETLIGAIRDSIQNLSAEHRSPAN